MLPLRPNSPTSRLPLVGFTLIRVIVPLWIATGATMKLIAKDPGLLPRKTVFRWGIDLGIDLDVYLGTLIAIEYLLALTIVLVPLLSRTAAIAQLLAFVAVLFGEMLKGNFFDCGCLGGASPPPWVMLTIDMLLLLGCIVLPLPRRGGPEAGSPTGRHVALARNAVGLVVVLLVTTGLTLLTFSRLGVLGAS